MKKNMLRGLAVAGFLVALSACTAGRPPQAYLPSRASIKSGPTVTVKGGENIYTIARQHNVSMRETIVLNDLKPPYTLRKGQRLVIPAGGSEGDVSVSALAPSPSSYARAGASASGAGSVISSAPEPSITPVEQSALPPITPPSVSAQPLAPVAPPSLAQPTATPFKSGVSSAPVSSAPPEAPVAKPVETDVVQALNRPSPASKTAETATTTSETSLSMKWPIQGPILSGFGAKTQGMINDGINIGAPKGAPVVASAPGIVVYAGNEMKGFGNLVLIRHEGDIITAYSHLDRVLVKRDSVVAQGDMIGTVGKTGNVAAPQLHFEVRLDGKAVDPAKFVKGSL